MLRLLLASLCLLAISFDAYAKNCTKGQPCGNSCISWNKTCRIGSSSSTSSYSPAPRPPYQTPTVTTVAPVIEAATQPPPARDAQPTAPPTPSMNTPKRSAPANTQIPVEHQPLPPRGQEAVLRMMYVARAFTSALAYPSRSAQEIRRLEVGQQVPVYEVLSNWARITTGSAANEWVPLEALSDTPK